MAASHEDGHHSLHLHHLILDGRDSPVPSVEESGIVTQIEEAEVAEPLVQCRSITDYWCMADVWTKVRITFSHQCL